ncbi:hypothetical protein [Chromobacterium phragmitis]|uniref:Uncharacterized protein n=1 Tax=Chromobacterium phragmitis TaxID=2202141 RepID=A0ABV0IVJ6_9NEIS
MAMIDPVREARRAFRHLSSAKAHLSQLPDSLRSQIFSIPPRNTPLPLILPPEALHSLLEVIYSVECARDRLNGLLTAAGSSRKLASPQRTARRGRP